MMRLGRRLAYLPPNRNHDAMPVFFFNFWDHKAYVSDPKGIELPNLDAVRDEAIRSARDILDDGLAKGDDRIGWTFDIKDNTDQTVLTVPFAEADRKRPPR
jgi:hypothetical protein